MSADVIAFPAGPTVVGDGHPELDLLSAAQLLDFRKYYCWRVDCLFLLDATDQPWFANIDLQEYHHQQMKGEIDFCISCIAAINRRLKGMGI